MKAEPWDVAYLPWFSASALENDWPKGWMPEDFGTNDLAIRQRATESRNVQLGKGVTGTIHGLSPKSDKRLKTINSPSRLARAK